MYKRFWIICSVVAAALAVLSGLGLSSLGMHEKGLRAERRQEFIDVARHVSFDIKQTVDSFLQSEQARPYTDYQYYYVPQTSNQAAALMRSPLGESLSNGLAYGYFQLDNAGQVATPYAAAANQAAPDVKTYLDNLQRHLLPSLDNGHTLQVRRIAPQAPRTDAGARQVFRRESDADISRPMISAPASEENLENEAVQSALKEISLKTEAPDKTAAKGAPSRRAIYPIELDEEQKTKVVSQSRVNYEMNTYSNQALQQQPSETQRAFAEADRLQTADEAARSRTQEAAAAGRPPPERQSLQQQISAARQAADPIRTADQRSDGDMVQVRIEPFVPMTVPEPNGARSVFSGQVFLLRHIQIEDKHFVQGFRLDEAELMRQITASAEKFIRRGMGFEIAKAERPDAAYTAVLDFGFGEVMLNLLETQPGWLQARVDRIRNWFFAILAVVWLAVIIALGAFWRNLNEQVQLSRKKDDFISAVSHELRTPLTSIRMYTEMLEKDWVKTEDKRRQYYATMRQESERLSRLIENVLDFSRIQRGKKRYNFTLGDVNACVADVVRMMTPCAERAGFELVTELGEMEPFLFDRDAVVQIVINLLDNALKYANGTSDKRVIIRTRKQKACAVIEVEDHGPGVARSRQKKIFDAFYRCGDESTRQTTGTGLGLALVKRFAEAHHGFVEIAGAKPSGAVFRVGLAFDKS